MKYHTEIEHKLEDDTIKVDILRTGFIPEIKLYINDVLQDVDY